MAWFVLSTFRPGCRQYRLITSGKISVDIWLKGGVSCFPVSTGVVKLLYQPSRASAGGKHRDEKFFITYWKGCVQVLVREQRRAGRMVLSHRVTKKLQVTGVDKAL